MSKSWCPSKAIIERAEKRNRLVSGAVLDKSHCYPEVKQARKEVAAELRTVYKWSLPRIARVMKRHHTTVINWLGTTRYPEPVGDTWIDEIAVPDLSGEWAV